MDWLPFSKGHCHFRSINLQVIDRRCIEPSKRDTKNCPLSLCIFNFSNSPIFASSFFVTEFSNVILLFLCFIFSSLDFINSYHFAVNKLTTDHFQHFVSIFSFFLFWFFDWTCIYILSRVPSGTMQFLPRTRLETKQFQVIHSFTQSVSQSVPIHKFSIIPQFH